MFYLKQLRKSFLSYFLWRISNFSLHIWNEKTLMFITACHRHCIKCCSALSLKMKWCVGFRRAFCLDCTFSLLTSICKLLIFRQTNFCHSAYKMMKCYDVIILNGLYELRISYIVLSWWNKSIILTICYVTRYKMHSNMYLNL